jgi:hypothetical protein
MFVVYLTTTSPTSGYKASNDRMIMHNELQGIRKETAKASFMLLYRYLLEGLRNTKHACMAGHGPRYEHRTSRYEAGMRPTRSVKTTGRPTTALANT